MIHFSDFPGKDTTCEVGRQKEEAQVKISQYAIFLIKGLILLPSLKITFLENRFTNNRFKKCIQSILKDRSLWDIEISIFWSKKLTGEWQPHLQGGIFWFGKAFGALQFLSNQLSRKLLKVLNMAFQLCVTFKCFQRRTF